MDGGNDLGGVGEIKFVAASVNIKWLLKKYYSMELIKTEPSKINAAPKKEAAPFFAFGQNHAVATSFFQPKLTINQPNDPYEQEADAMAEKVMRMTGPTIQKKCADCENEEEKKVQLKPTGIVQKEDGAEAEVPSAEVPSPLSPSSAAPSPAVTSPNFQLPLPSSLRLSTEPDFLAMRQPFFQRNIPHLFDADSALQVWQYNFDFFRRFGIAPNLAASASNFTAPFSIDSQLKTGNPTWWEITDRDLGTTTYNASLPILDFNADFSPTAPSWFKTLFSGGSPSVQRKCDDCEDEEEKKVQMKESIGNAQATEGFENYVTGLDGSGQQLPADVRSFYEPRFGYDFSNVRIHTDTVAAKSAQSINALAYTTGSNIVFGAGQYAPGNDSGKRLLGHELTHVVQQTNNIQRDETDAMTSSDPSSIIYDALDGWTSSSDSEAIRDILRTPTKAFVDRALSGVAALAGITVIEVIEWLKTDMVSSDWEIVLGHLIDVQASHVENAIASQIQSLLSGYTSDSDSAAILGYFTGTHTLQGDLLTRTLQQLESVSGNPQTAMADWLFGDMTSLNADHLRNTFSQLQV